MITSAGQEKIIESCLRLCSELTKFNKPHLWVDYDQEADVLYLSFRKPQKAKKTIEMENDILVRTDGGDIVGITIMNASTR